MHGLEEKLQRFLNQESAESQSSTPDNVLAVYLTNTLQTFNEAINSFDDGSGTIHPSAVLSQVENIMLTTQSGHMMQAINLRNDFYDRVSG